MDLSTLREGAVSFLATATISPAIAQQQLNLAFVVDSEKGNEWIAIDELEGFFACSSLSDSFFAFSPLTRKFTELDPLPRPRYRHSSAIVGGKVWIIGGRSIEDDSLIAEIDVYDIETKAWSEVLLPTEFQVSDHASFAQEPSFVYIAGGYNKSYTALDTLARIDTTTIENDSLTIETQAPLSTARGDIIGISATDGNSAFVTGGFTHANGFCAPLGSTEEYVFASNEWRSLPDLVNERGEVVLVQVEHHLYALGGERQIEGYCDGAGDDIDPGEKTVGTDEVESYDLADDVWTIVSGFPNHKFRFAAAAGVDGLIYAFGGQTAYDSGCQCFKTASDVQTFVTVDDDVDASNAAPITAFHFVAVAALIGALFI
jgi:N-acetylneuraminic acid mutarotase